MRGLITLTIVATMLATACGGGDDDEAPVPKVDCTSGVPTYAMLKTTALSKCLPCHSSTVTGPAHLGKVGVDYDTYDLAKANAPKGASEIAGGDMPDMPYTMDDSEKQLFYKWSQCGTPQ
jgi:hypothetical protein